MSYWGYFEGFTFGAIPIHEMQYVSRLSITPRRHVGGIVNLNNKRVIMRTSESSYDIVRLFADRVFRLVYV